MKPDAELHAQAIAGGPDAFVPVVQRYQDAVFSVALARLRNFHDAEDVAQEVFVKAFQRLAELKEPARLGAWLRTMTIHNCIDLQRRGREHAGAEHCERQESALGSPDTKLEQQELRDKVLAAIAKLSKTQRETTTLFYINGYSVSDIANMQEVPVGTIKSRLHDARKRLKEEMMSMVEDALKSGAPKRDFADRVFNLLCLYGKKPPSWPPTTIIKELQKIGIRGVDGFARAMQLRHSPTRRFTVGILAKAHDASTDDTRERLIALLKEGLRDTNKKVRTWTVPALLHLQVDEQRRKNDLIPAVLPLLRDPTRRVRHRAAYELQSYPEHVPVEVVATAFAEETDGNARAAMAKLIHLIIDHKKPRAKSNLSPSKFV